MKVLFIEPYPTEGPSSRYRVEQYIPYLTDKGISCIVRPFVSSSFYKILYKKGSYFKKAAFFFQNSLKRFLDLFIAMTCDVVFIHLEAFPLGPPVFEWVLSKLGKRIVYDLDDAIYMRVSSPANRIVRFLKYPSKIKEIIKMSDHVITCNRHLGEYVSKFNNNVSVIPTSLDTDRFTPKKNRNAKRLILGWIGSHSTAPYLNLLKNVICELNKKFQFDLKIIGAGSYRLDIPTNNVSISYPEWSLHDEIQQLQSFDIGIYPLPETEWILGKTGFKTVQYMSVSIPCVVSGFGANKEIVQDGINGFLANSDQEWVEKISRLMEDAELREKMGAAGRKTVEEKYSLRLNAPRYVDILSNIYDNKVT